MIAQILKYLNNYFVVSRETTTLTIAMGVLTGPQGDYLENQYIAIKGTILNDGVYKITDITDGVYTVDATLKTETIVAEVYGLAIPPDLVSLIGEITTYAATATDGLVSESQGGRSVTYKTDSSWQNLYKSRLIPYKRIFPKCGVRL